MSERFKTLNQMVQHYTGMRPDLDRKALLPRVTTEVVQPEGQGPRHVVTDVIAPQALYELAKAYFAPGYAASGAYSSPEQAVDDAVNTALNVELGGGLASHAAGPVEPVIGMAVKQRGGNWPKTSSYDPEKIIGRFKNEEEDYLRTVIAQPEHYGDRNVEWAKQRLKEVVEPDLAHNAWVDQKLAKYIRNEMATPEDPLRRLAGEGIMLNRQALAESELRRAAENRAGSPRASFESKTADEALWENRADALIESTKLSEVMNPSRPYNEKELAQTIEANPWMKKIDPETPVNFITSEWRLSQDTGFRHMLDNLKASMTEEGMPAELRLRPDQLKNVSMEDAVRRSVAIDNWRSEEALRVTKEEMAEIAKTGARLEAPSLDVSFVDQKGGKWVDLPDAIDKRGNAVCTAVGKAGGWCTMHAGSAEAYGSGSKSLTALLDADGRPHVQVQAGKLDFSPETFEQLGPAELEALSDAMAKRVLKWNRLSNSNLYNYDYDEAKSIAESLIDNSFEWIDRNGKLRALDEYEVEELIQELGKAERSLIEQQDKLLPSIFELKPPGNTFESAQAREYIRRDPNYKQKISQQVLDFLNAGEWSSTVNDLEHYGIVDLDARMSKRPKGTPRFMFTKDFNTVMAKELGFAEGGPVHYDHARIDQLTNQFIARHNG